MRFGILSDIHGNLEALQSVLNDIDRSEIDRVFSLGDNIGYGPDPEAVMNLLKRRDIHSILGNHEMVVKSPRYEKWFNDHVKKTLRLTHSRLSEESKARIRQMKAFHVESGFRLVHGFPPKSPLLYLFQVSGKKIRRVLNWRIRERLCFVGHTHDLQMIGYDGNKLRHQIIAQGRYPLNPRHRYIINAGSVGQPRDGNNNAKYVIWDSDIDAIDVRYVPYDIERVIKKIKKAGYPDYFGERLR